jgi:ribosome biogenesis GTPase / thiamine phosphate phosphatase
VSNSSALRDFGFNRHFEESFAFSAGEGEAAARVVEEHRDRYRVLREGPDGSPLEEDAQVSGAFRRRTTSPTAMPAVGDWVSLKPGSGGPAIIESLLPRQSAFIRKAPGDAAHDRVEAQVVAANVDTAFVVTAAGRDWNPRRVERYLALARAASVEALLVLTKADLAHDPAALLAEARRAAPGIGIALICAPEGAGLEALAPRLGPGRTVVLLGSSGAGKSTLLNALAGEKLAATQAVREDDERGRHTTTHRQLFRLPSGALAIDTPGMRELQLWADEGDVASAFPELEELAGKCRFRDCRHQGEPGCAVRAALESGGLDEERYESWRKLAKEAAFLRTREDYTAKDAERRRWKSIEKSMKPFKNRSSRGG